MNRLFGHHIMLVFVPPIRPAPGRRGSNNRYQNPPTLGSIISLDKTINQPGRQYYSGVLDHTSLSEPAPDFPFQTKKLKGPKHGTLELISF